jgi:peroxiredoxin Q/BCP
MALTIGDKIPKILGVNQDGSVVKSADYAGKKFVLYFYPKDSTPGCTAEACSFRDGFQNFRKAGCEILGVSVDSETSHRKFIEKQQLPFPLIADKEKILVNSFGVWAEKTLAGRKYMGTLRTTFLINEQGVIERMISPKEIKTKDHANQILELIK